MVCGLDPDVVNVPWEFTYYDGFGGGRYFNTFKRTPFTRFYGDENKIFEYLNKNDKPEIKHNVNTLFITSNPTGASYLIPKLKLKKFLKSYKNCSIKRQSIIPWILNLCMDLVGKNFYVL